MALDDDTLQRYHDGALAPSELAAVEREIAASPSAQRRLRELTQLTELMRSAVSPRARALDSDALFARIEAGIEKEEALGLGARLKLLTSEWIEHKRAVAVPLMASAAVAAAALLTFLVPHGTRDPGAPEEGSPLAALGNGAGVHGSSIENVDFGQSTGTVFEVDNEGVRAAVVWIADDEEAP